MAAATAAPSSVEQIKHDVVAKLIHEFGSDPETLTRALHCLDEEEVACRAEPEMVPPALVTMVEHLRADDHAAFRKFVQSLVGNMRTTDREISYLTKVVALHIEMMEPATTDTNNDQPSSLDDLLDDLLNHQDSRQRKARDDDQAEAPPGVDPRDYDHVSSPVNDYDQYHSTKSNLDPDHAADTHLDSHKPTLHDDRNLDELVGDLCIDQDSDQSSNLSLIDLEYDHVSSDDFDVAKKTSFAALSRVWSRIPAVVQAAILDYVRNIAITKSESAAGPIIHHLARLLLVSTGAVVAVALVGVYLSYHVLQTVWRWWHGEIGGARCSKNVLDSLATLGAGMSGGVAGATLGSMAGGPVGSVVGGFVGAVFTSLAANHFANRLTERIFGIPRSEALENAYKYLGVNMEASNAEINSRFRRLCLQHHPDKGGSAEEFNFLQLNMATVKMARGEMYGTLAGGAIDDEGAAKRAGVVAADVPVLPITEK